MFDWFILLSPLLLLPIVLLFVFVGCFVDRSGLATGFDLTCLAIFSPSLDEASDFRVFIDINRASDGRIVTTLENRRSPGTLVDGRYEYRLGTTLPTGVDYLLTYQVWPERPGASRLLGPESCLLRFADVAGSTHEVRFTSAPDETSVTADGCV